MSSSTSSLPPVDEHSVEEGGVAPPSSSPRHRNPTLHVDTACDTPKEATARQLSAVSELYDRTGKGYLDTVEQKMRAMDTAGEGHLSNEAVYNLIRDSQKKMVTQRWLLIGLAGFAIVLALANMGTALVAARLTKETEVTPAGDLVSKDTHERLGTTSKSLSFDLGSTQDMAGDASKRRRLGLLGGFDRHELGSFNFLSEWSAQSLWRSFDTDGSAVQLRWTCGIGGGGSSFSYPIVSAERTPYVMNVTDAVTGVEEEVMGVYYEYHLRMFNAEAKTIKVDCGDDSAGCVVTGTGCCGSNNDCGDREICAMCGCRCVDVDAVVPHCMSSPACSGGYEAW